MKTVCSRTNRLILLLFILTVSKTAVSQPSHPQNNLQTGNTRYVATNGSDSNPGTLAAPFATIQHAVSRAAAGDTIYVRGGTYVEAIVMRNSGTAFAPITIAAYANEQPIIDGQYTLPAVPDTGWAGCNTGVSPAKCFHYVGLVWIKANHIVLEGFEIKRSLGRGIVVSLKDDRPTDIIIRNNQIHDLRNSALIILDGDNIRVTGNDIYHAGEYATPNRSSSSLSWPVAVNALRSTSISYTNNQIHNNWGEGISTGRGSAGITMTGNVFYDNFALNLYIHRSQQIRLQRNLVYCTNDPDFRRGGNPPPGIIINNETNFDEYITVENVHIVNNIVTGCRQNFAVWSAGTERVRNLLLAHNTLVNATSNPGMTEAIGIGFPSGNYQNVRVYNNIIYQPKHDPGWSAGSPDITFAHNLWSATPHESVQGAGDIIANPQLINPDASLLPGAVDAGRFRLQASSPAVDTAVFVGELQDYFNNPRGLSADIGMHEHPAGVIHLLAEKVYLPLSFRQ